MANKNPEIEFAQDQLNQQIANDPNAMIAAGMKEEKVNNILSQINPDNLLSDIEHRIRGDRKDVYSGSWIKGKNTINPLLIDKFITFLGCILNQNTSMSNFTEGEINNLMDLVIGWISKELRTNSTLYGIERQYSEWDRIGHIICMSCFTVFKRALNGQESRRIFKILHISQKDDTEKKKGVLDMLKFW